jgi:hypothetical protein
VAHYLKIPVDHQETIKALNRSRINPSHPEAEQLTAADDEIVQLLEDCTEHVPEKRPNSLQLLQVARTCLEMAQRHRVLPLSFVPVHKSREYALLIMLKYLTRLFHSFKESVPAERPDWSSRLLLYWEDFGHHIVWSEQEAALLEVLLQISYSDNKKAIEAKQRENDEERRRKGYQPRKQEMFIPAEKPPHVEKYLSGCRWDTFGLLVSDLERGL